MDNSALGPFLLFYGKVLPPKRSAAGGESRSRDSFFWKERRVGMEPTQMLSVGIDIGTSTSQVIFSRLTVENTAGYFSVPAVSIIGKEVVYQSPVHRTPLIDESLIDGRLSAK